MINLYIPYFKFDNEERNKEILNAIVSNLKLNYIDKIYLLCENQESLDFIKRHTNEKTILIPQNKRVTYYDVFQKSNENTNKDDINILLNNDIILKRFDKIFHFLNRNNVFLCISRHEKDGQLIHIPDISQDIWVWKGLNRIKNCDFPMGKLGCDTALAYMAKQSGYETINPCKQLIALHSHASNYRTYNIDERMTIGHNTPPLSEICIVRPTYYDRSAMLQLSLEYQKAADYSEKFETYIFVDPHPEHGIVSDYDKVITDEYTRIDWSKNSGKYSWYDSVKYIFDNTDYDYVLSIEDDVLISKDYLRMCEQLFHDCALNKNDNILYFHIGAWEKRKWNPNKIVRSGVSSRSILIYRKKFELICKWVKQQQNRMDYDPMWTIKDNDHMINSILKDHNMTTIAPETNRHGHIGVYGWSATFLQKISHEGQKSLFEKPLTHEELYLLLKQNCLSGEKLRELNNNQNPDYFWDFDPDINFEQLKYSL